MTNHIKLHIINKRQLVLILVFISVIMALGGYWYYDQEKEKIRQASENTISAITMLKNDRIEAWHKDELLDVQLIAGHGFLIEMINKYLKTGLDEDKNNISGFLKQINAEHGYHEVFIASLNGDIISSGQDNQTKISATELKTVENAIATGKSVSTGLFQTVLDGNEAIFMSYISVIKIAGNNQGVALVCRMDPYMTLYPLVESWPIPSLTAETFIFIVADDSILYLNNLKYQASTALKLKIPLSQSYLPASKAASGFTGIVSGKDYRNVDVVAYTSKIDGTPWYIISKIDSSEAFAEMSLIMMRIAAFVLIGILLVGFGVGLVYNLRQMSIYRELYRKEKEIWQQQEKFKVTVDSLGDGVILTDTEAKVQYMNSLAETLTGWKLREARGRSLGEVYEVRNEETGLKENNILEKVIKHGIVKELANHTILISKSGKEIPVVDTGAPVHDSDGTILGIVITFQDETEKRLQQRLIKESEERLRSSLDNMIEGCQIISSDYTYLYMNKAAVESSRKPKDELLGNTMMACYPGIEKTEMFSMLKKSMELRLSTEFENVFTFPDGEERVFRLRFEPVPEGIFLLSEDITETKNARDFILKFKMGIELSGDVVFLTDKEGIITYVNPTFERVFGYSKEEAIGKSPRLIKSGQLTTSDYEKIWEKLLVKKPENREVVNKTKDGKLLYFEVSINPIINDLDETIGYIAIERDITARKLAEKVQSQLTAIIEAAPDFIGTADLDGSPIYINNAGRKMVGIGPDEDISKLKIIDFHPEWAGQLILNEGIPAAVQNGIWYGETTILQRDGNERPISQTILAHRTNEGEIGYFSTIGRDITESKKFEADLIEKTTILGAFFDNTLTLIALLDTDFNFIRVNQAYAASDEKDVDFFVGKNHFDLYPSDATEIFEEVVRSKTEYHALEKPFIYAKNPERGVTYWDWSLVPLLKAHGEVDSLIFTLLNVTERVKAKSELVENEKFLTTMFNSVNDAIFTVSMPDRIIQSANKAVSDLFGCKIEEVIGKQARIFYPDEESFIQFGRHLSSAIIDDQPFVREELTLQKNDGHIIPCEVQSTFLKQSGEVDMVISVVRDMTERKEMIDEIIKAKEKAEASDSLKTAFINNISHEIRTPLNGILGFGQFLASPELTNNERKEYYAHVEQSSHRLMNTVTDYMDMALIYSGTMEINRKVLLFRPFLEQLIDTLSPRCETKGIALIKDLPEGSPDHELYTDYEFIKKIFTILFENALKFTEKGSITCGYRILPGFIEVFIVDTGKGIDAGKLEFIFKMFTQEDVSNTRGHEGSGLGLTIAKGLVHLLGGIITVDSIKGKGSTFTFTIPLDKHSSMSTQVKTTEVIKIAKNIVTVLVVEDDESNYLYIKTVLNSLGYRHIYAANGAEAVEICQQNPEISLILMDIKMPVMNGIEATKLIRRFKPDLPIIATTAYAQTGDEHRFLEAGCNDYIAKPINKDRLIKLLSQYDTKIHEHLGLE